MYSISVLQDSNKSEVVDKLANKDKNDFLSKLAISLVSLPYDLFRALLTPEGVKYIAEFEGLQMGYSLFKISVGVVVARTVNSGAIESISASLTEYLAGKAGQSFINCAAIQGMISTAIMESEATALAKQIASLTLESLDVAGTIFMIVNLIGMFLDIIDPQGYNQYISQDMIDKLQATFDTEVNNAYLGGSATYQLPVEYYVDSSYFVNSILFNRDSGSNDIVMSHDDQLRLSQYNADYLCELLVNSRGETIRWPDSAVDNTKHLTSHQISGVWDQSTFALAHGNITVYEFISKYWYIVLIFLLLVLVALFTVT